MVCLVDSTKHTAKPPTNCTLLFERSYLNAYRQHYNTLGQAPSKAIAGIDVAVRAGGLTALAGIAVVILALLRARRNNRSAGQSVKPHTGVKKRASNSMYAKITDR